MPTIPNSKISTVKKLYKDGFSAREISEHLNVPIDAVYYCMRRNRIERRNRSEMRARVFEKKELSYKINDKLTKDEEYLKLAGVLLYWAEGSKWPGEKMVDFANSDPVMIKIFIKFLREICNVQESRIRAYLYCYNNQDIDELLKFWLKLTRLTKQQFTKPYIKKDFNRNKSGKMKHGLLHIRYSDKKLLYQIKDWIEEIKTTYN